MVFARFTTFIFLATLGFTSCSRAPVPKPEVILLHSGRMRGNVYPLGLQNISPLQHYPYLAGYIAKVRQEAKATGARVFVVDLGDSMGGSFASHVTGSENMAAFFNAAGYDAVLLSNLDGSIPQAAIQNLKCKVLSPFYGPQGLPALPPAGARLEKDNLSLFLLANFYGDTDPAVQPGRFPAGFGKLTEGVLPVRDYQPVLESLGARPENSLTVFGWMKFEPASKPPEKLLENLRKLGVDAILAHRIYGNNEREAWQANAFVDWKPPVSLNILRNNGGFALARLDLAREGNGWKVLSHELVPMTANNTPADQEAVAAIEKFAPQIQAADFPICEVPAPVDAGRILEIYMAALATIPGTDAVAYSAESIRSDWVAGTLRASNLFNTLPWNTGLVQMKLPPDRLQSLISSGIVRIAGKAPVDGPVCLTTSYFFSQLISRQPGLEGVEVTALPQTSEYDFFLEYLKTNPGAISTGLPTGWSFLSPR
ncbi:MAG: hypothetical protein ACOYM3_03290 [Terrimicrobiaceae bacterium]